MNNLKLIKFLFFLGLIAGCVLLGQFLNIDIEYYKAVFAQYSVILSGIIFIVSYVITTTFIWLGPRDVFRLFGAIFYGPVISTILVTVADLIGATVLFYLSRFLGRDFIEQKWKKSTQDIERAKTHNHMIGIMALRLNPLVPFAILDLSYGLTQISFVKYFWGILLATIIRVVWLQSILAQVGTAIFKDYKFVLEYFVNHPFILYYSGIYFLAVVVLSLWALTLKLKNKKV